MKVAAALAVAATLALPASSGASSERVLGIDSTVLGMRLAWYDPATLTRLPGKTVPLANHDGGWALSPNGKRLVVSSMVGEDLRFIDVRRMHVVGTVKLGTKFPAFALKWLGPNRLLAVGTYSATLVDPQRLRVIRRTFVPGVVADAVALPNGFALLLGQDVNGFATAKVATVDAEGRVWSRTLDRVTIGFRHVGDAYEQRQAGFAVDSASRRAFVVGGDYTIAAVDLASRAVSYHGGSSRRLEKEVPGPMRWARWLGNGLIAVAGMDGVERDGLRIVDTRDWSTRFVDSDSVNLTVAPGVLLGSAPFCCPLKVAAYALDGTPRYAFELESGLSFWAARRYGYVCHGLSLVRVIDLASGATVSTPHGSFCVTLLTQ